MALIDLISAGARPAAAPRARPGLMQRLAVWRSRRDLAHLDAAALDDIGVSRETALREAGRGPWDVPQSWVER